MDNSARNAGNLYIIATPIGNQEDITLRAISTLQTVDKILAEDTRHSMQLLTNLGIKKPLIALHAHNEAQKSDEILHALLAGESFALISDAGTPLINDPGFPLVALAQSHGISVVPIPGACALIAALSAAGVSCDTFTFYGFLPAKKAARCAKLDSLKSVEHTLIFYESTHRIAACLQDISTTFGADCPLVLAKELTKTFERFISGTCTQVIAWLAEDITRCKGEFVLIIPPRVIKSESEGSTRILSILLAELPLKQAVKLACQITQEAKNEVYKRALELAPRQ